MKEERIPSGHALPRSPATGLCEYMKEKTRPNRRIFAFMLFANQKCSSISREQLISVDAKSSNVRRGNASLDDGIIIPNRGMDVKS